MKIGANDTAEHPFLVAEIGNNHEGSFDVARELVEKAAECGVDAVKFQTFRTKYYVSSRDEARSKRLQSFELSVDQFGKLAELAKSLGLSFISTPFDLDSARGIEGFVDAFKIASGDNDFYPLVREVSLKRKPLIISTGLSDLAQVRDVINYVRGVRAAAGIDAEMAVLHCVSAYPAPPSEVNLRAIGEIRRVLDCEVGYSDHTMGSMACLAAVAIGATIIEKHFTLDKHYSEFRDHQLSADPPEMKLIAQQMKEFFALRGSERKEVQPSEKGNVVPVRRSIVAARDMAKGEMVSDGDLTWIRPRDGLRPGREHLLLGKRLIRAVEFGRPILTGDVE